MARSTPRPAVLETRTLRLSCRQSSGLLDEAQLLSYFTLWRQRGLSAQFLCPRLEGRYQADLSVPAIEFARCGLGEFCRFQPKDL